MKNVGRYVNLIIGCLIIGIGINLFIRPYELISFGVNGIGLLINYQNGVGVAFNILLINLMCLLLGYMTLDKKVIKNYLPAGLLIPFAIFITEFITNLIKIELSEMMLVVIVAGALLGYGYALIYKQGFSAGGTLLLEEVIGHITYFHSKIYSWIFDIIILIVYLFLYDYQMALYSFIMIVITKYMITKARFGISDSKMFYVITSQEKEVKNFIIHDLKYELTVLDVKGGFSKKNNQILLTVISTEDYYRLKEGIKIIDPKAFIAITDTYDVVNRKSF